MMYYLLIAFAAYGFGILSALLIMIVLHANQDDEE